MEENKRNSMKLNIEAVRLSDDDQVLPKESYKTIPEYPVESNNRVEKGKWPSPRMWISFRRFFVHARLFIKRIQQMFELVFAPVCTGSQFADAIWRFREHMCMFFFNPYMLCHQPLLYTCALYIYDGTCYNVNRLCWGFTNISYSYSDTVPTKCKTTHFIR